MCATISNDPKAISMILYSEIEQIEFYFIVVSFGLFFVAYSLILYVLTSRLKKFFPSFFLKERSKIYLASISILFSISARIFFVCIYEIDSLNEKFDDSFKNNTWLWPIMQFLTLIFASLVPVASIIYSLMYAITHKKRMIKKS
jgi:hypothetical protein